MSQKVYAVTNKVNTRSFAALIVKRLELPDKILEGCIAILKLLWSNNRTLEYLNPRNQSAVVFPVRSWKDMSQ